jgi:hypothetical protein
LEDDHVQQLLIHEGGRFPHENLGGDTYASIIDSEEDLPIFSPVADDNRRRLRSRRQSTSSGERTQNRVFWGGGLGRRKASWVASTRLAQLCATPPGHGRLGPSPPTHTTLSEQPFEDDMPTTKRRACKRVLVNGNWFDAHLRATMFAVERGSHVQTAALDFDIPRTTLRGHVMGLTLSRKRVKKPVLIAVKEDKVVKYIIGMAIYRHPINIMELKIKMVEATQMCENPFKDGIPGVGWIRWF